MASKTQQLAEKELITIPDWLPANMCYEALMGSHAYATNDLDSDLDLYGFCIPPKEDIFPHLQGIIPGFGRPVELFTTYNNNHITEPDSGRVYDLRVHSIVKFFQLAMANNPNMLDTLWVSDRCITHCTKIGSMVRDNRKLFLHKGLWHKFKGYSFQQLKKMGSQKRTGKRKEIFDKFGFDCYLEEETEFLTESGWARFDDIPTNTKIAGLNKNTGEIDFQLPSGTIDKIYTGKCYIFEPHMTRFVVTPGHCLLVSPTHGGSAAANFSTEYYPELADWHLTPLADLLSGYRSWYHIKCRTAPRTKELEMEDNYLSLGGLFVSEGTVNFYKGQVRAARVSQTPNGKKEFYDLVDKMSNTFGLKRYNYNKESIWIFPRAVAERVFADFGHGSANKRLPKWAFQLSHRQAKVFWDALCLGDGTRTTKDNGDVYYTINAGLAADIQAMMIAAGFSCSVRGPYYSTSNFNGKQITTYQVYLPDDQRECRAITLNSILPAGADLVDDNRRGFPIKEVDIAGKRVVCFTHPTGVLITRSGGKVAIQGNCKFALHLVRLLLEAEMLLTEQDMDLERHREHLKAIKRGDISEAEIKHWAAEKEKFLERAYEESKLPWGPDETAIKRLLVNCLEEHYGNLSKEVKLADIRIEAMIEGLKKVLAEAEKLRQ